VNVLGPTLLLPQRTGTRHFDRPSVRYGTGDLVTGPLSSPASRISLVCVGAGDGLAWEQAMQGDVHCGQRPISILLVVDNEGALLRPGDFHSLLLASLDYKAPLFIQQLHSSCVYITSCTFELIAAHGVEHCGISE